MLHAGSAQQLSVTFTPNDTTDYAPDSATVLINVNKATPVVAWADPAPITAGTPLSAAQLDATASVPGTLTYSEPAGTVLAAGSRHVLSVTFSPEDATDYESVTARVSIDVLAQGQGQAQAPYVTGIAAGSHTKKGLTSITVAFDESMNPGSVMSASNYTVFGAVTKKRRTLYAKALGIRQISYNDSTHTATITFVKPYKGVVQATARSGIMAASGAVTSTPFMMTAN